MSVLAEQPLRHRTIDVGATLRCYRHGAGDPTTWLEIAGRGIGSGGRFVRATRTPDGPGTVQICWGPGAGDGLDVTTWGPGGTWLGARAAAMAGHDDPGHDGLERDEHPRVASAARNHRSLRLGASADLYHELLPTIIEQRITIGEAHRQWHRLCAALGEPAPGPFARLLVPPDPAVLSRQPSWRFRPLGIERTRAEPLIEVARHASKLWAWADAGSLEAARKLPMIRGVGRWTVGSVLGPALGDPDAVAVGDYHLKNVIGWSLAGEARATDERMLELLAPYAGQRGRVVRLLRCDGASAPRFGAKQRILPMRTW